MAHTKKKIGLIGGGQIGGNLALLAVQKQLGDVVLYGDSAQADAAVSAVSEPGGPHTQAG